MFFAKRSLIFSTLALVVLVLIDAEPEPRRRSKVSSDFQTEDNNHTREGKGVCSLRLDFESFSIQGTGNTAEIDTELVPLDPGGVCLDTFDVSTNTGNNIPTICGQNTGQHIYVDIGNLASDTAQLNFAFSGSSNNRQWEIKVTQIPCSTQGHPNGCGCLQYHTGLTGRLTTFNFLPTNDNHLANQQ
eukprot:maker-scaffold47_size466558-snap-gene-0.18 protein:Tk04177 transcript:maker-scaffold47_size466558-snap-gene-0.18-mRNA-1 annotation:"hypothetical protein KGM_18655"